MLLTILLFIVIIMLFIGLPIYTLKKYYEPQQYQLGNWFIILFTIVTWPLVPIGIAYMRRDSRLLAYYWGGFLFFIVIISYWLVINVELYNRIIAQIYA